VWSAEPPIITDASPSLVKAALGRSVSLTCRAFGAPSPVISWSRGDAETWSVEHVHDNETDTGQDARVIVDDVGTLIIRVTTAVQTPHRVHCIVIL